MTVKNIDFRFGNQTYKQIDGVAMGSPIGPLLADIFLASLERGRMKEVIEGSGLCARYLDDTLLVIDETVNVNEMLNIFNSMHINRAFTNEEETEDALNFLDVLVVKKEERAEIRKPSVPSQFLQISISFQ